MDYLKDYLEKTLCCGGRGGGLLSLPSLILASCLATLLCQVRSSAGRGMAVRGLQHGTRS